MNVSDARQHEKAFREPVSLDSLTAGELARFWGYVDKGSGGCWLWLSDLNKGGYGRFVVMRGKVRHRLMAHRLAYLLEVGRELGDRTLVRVKPCRSKACCNPAHWKPLGS